MCSMDSECLGILYTESGLVGIWIFSKFNKLLSVDCAIVCR